jgi:hypothetical protein
VSILDETLTTASAIATSCSEARLLVDSAAASENARGSGCGSEGGTAVSVLVTLRINGDVDQFRRLLETAPERFSEIEVREVVAHA